MSESQSDQSLVVYSDYVCPFCYLGKASLESYLDEADDPPAVEWHQFDLRGYERGPDGEIDPDADTGKDEEYFEQAKRNVERLADEYDVDLDVDLDRDVDSWNAQQVALYVQREYPDRFAEFNDRVFEAYWQAKRDVGDPDVLAEIAEEVGIPADEVRDAVHDETLEADLRGRFSDAKAAGVTGVPTFTYDEYAARGSIPPEQLRRLVEGT